MLSELFLELLRPHDDVGTKVMLRKGLDAEGGELGLDQLLLVRDADAAGGEVSR